MDDSAAGSDREAFANKLDELQVPDEFVLLDETYSEGPGLFVIGTEAALSRDYGLEGIDPEDAVSKFIEANLGLEQTGVSEGLRSFRDGDYSIGLFFDSGSKDPGKQLPKGVGVVISISLEPG